VLIGRSCHAEAEVDAAARGTRCGLLLHRSRLAHPTKPGRPAPGWTWCGTPPRSATDRPWFAIGGIDHGNVREVLAAGARRIVVVRAITEADDPAAAAAALAKTVRSYEL